MISPTVDLPSGNVHLIIGPKTQRRCGGGKPFSDWMGQLSIMWVPLSWAGVLRAPSGAQLRPRVLASGVLEGALSSSVAAAHVVTWRACFSAGQTPSSVDSVSHSVSTRDPSGKRGRLPVCPLPTWGAPSSALLWGQAPGVKSHYTLGFFVSEEDLLNNFYFL